MNNLKQLKCGTEVISYRILRKPNKHTYLAIKGEMVEVRANQRVSEAQIERLIRDKSQWILARLSQLDSISYEHVYLWGKRVSYEHLVSSTKHDLSLNTDPQTTLIACYRAHTQQYLAEYLPIFSDKMQLYPTKVSVRHTISRWGSCSARDALSFSLLAAQLPTSVMDYLIVHELAHIRHKHHQSSFWALVEQYCPNVNDERRKLRDYEAKIVKLK